MIINGRKISQEQEARLKQQVKQLLAQGVQPRLAVLVFQSDQAGQVYCGLKAQAGKRVGIKVVKFNLKGLAIKSALTLIKQLNQDRSYQGIMIQRPGYQGKKGESLWQKLVGSIALDKDVDGLRQGSSFVPATVKAILLILDQVKAQGRILIVGRGMVGQGLQRQLKAEMVSSREKNLKQKLEQADILLTCCGRPGLIKTVKLGAVVVDASWPKSDLDFDRVSRIARAITPVPGGVGPITVICLLENLVEAVYNQTL